MHREIKENLATSNVSSAELNALQCQRWRLFGEARDLVRASRWLHSGDEAPPQWAATNVRIVVGYRMTAPGAQSGHSPRLRCRLSADSVEIFGLTNKIFYDR